MSGIAAAARDTAMALSTRAEELIRSIQVDTSVTSRPGLIRIVQAVATLYRCNTPTDWLCPCGRVARALRREGIAVQVVVVGQRRSRRAEVEALSGQRRVPVLVLDGEVICDSKRILEHLEYRRSRAAPA
jgi:glutaredoxin